MTIAHAQGMSIKTKVIIAMAGLAASIVVVLFVVAQAITSSSINDTVNQAGVGYVRVVRAFGQQLDSRLKEETILATIREQRDSGALKPQWDQLVAAYGYKPATSRFHPAAKHETAAQLSDDLMWVLAASKYLEFGGTENNPNAVKVLGPDWLNYLDDRSPRPRRLVGTISEDNKPSGAQQKDLALLTNAQKGDGNVGTAIFNLFHTTLRKMVDDATVILEAQVKDERAQLAGIAYTPPARGMKFMEALAQRAGKAFDPVSSYRILVGLTETTIPEQGNSTDASGIVYDEGESNVGPVRRYRQTNLKKPEEMLIFLNSVVVEEAASKTVVMISVVAVLSLIIAITVAFILGGGVTAPIQALMKDMNVIATGNFDHHPKVRSNDEVGALAKVLGEMAVSLKANQELFQENMERKHELGLATEIQENLLPKTTPKVPGYDISAFYSTSKEVGGDYYDFFPIDKFHIGAICADVSGKGVPGSMVMMMAKALITYEAMGNLSPKDIFVKVNKAIAKDIKRGMFVTAFYVVLDVQNKEMTVASAGHNPMLIHRAATGEIEQVNPSGIALGFDKQGLLFEKNIQEQKVSLQSGDRVVIYTDGVPEAMSPAGEEFSDERFIALTKRCKGMSSAEYLQRLVTALRKHAQSDAQHDDITVVTMVVK